MSNEKKDPNILSISCTLINKLGSSLLAIGWTISINGPWEGEDKKSCSFFSKHVAYRQWISLGTLVASEDSAPLSFIVLYYYFICLIPLCGIFSVQKNRSYRIRIVTTHTSKSYNFTKGASFNENSNHTKQSAQFDKDFHN